jgi:membrane protein
MRISDLPPLLWSTVKSFVSDNVPRLGASLAYYTLFSIAPVLLVVIAIAGAIYGEEAVRGEIVGQLSRLVGTEGARTVEALVENASKPKQGLVATVIGTVTFVLAATGVFLELQAALNLIWRVKAKPTPGLNLRSFLLVRLRSFGLLVSIGFLLLVSLAMSAALAALGGWLGRMAPELPTILRLVNLVLSFAVTTLLFGLLYRFLPDVRLGWKDVAVGAAATAILFNVGKELIGLYIGQSELGSVYGAAGSVMVLLVWVYYSSQVVLLGAEFTRHYTERHRPAPEPEPFAKVEADSPVRATT